MMLCSYCQQELESRGEQFKVIKYYGYYAENCEEVKCDWCGEVDECDEVDFD